MCYFGVTNKFTTKAVSTKKVEISTRIPGWKMGEGAITSKLAKKILLCHNKKLTCVCTGHGGLM